MLNFESSFDIFFRVSLEDLLWLPHEVEVSDLDSVLFGCGPVAVPAPVEAVPRLGNVRQKPVHQLFHLIGQNHHVGVGTDHSLDAPGHLFRLEPPERKFADGHRVQHGAQRPHVGQLRVVRRFADDFRRLVAQRAARVVAELISRAKLDGVAEICQLERVFVGHEDVGRTDIPVGVAGQVDVLERVEDLDEVFLADGLREEARVLRLEQHIEVAALAELENEAAATLVRQGTEHAYNVGMY